MLKLKQYDNITNTYYQSDCDMSNMTLPKNRRFGVSMICS